MSIGDPDQGRANHLQRLALGLIGDLVRGQVIKQVLQLPGNAFELLAQHFLANRFDLASLQISLVLRIEVAHAFKSRPLLSIGRLDAGEKAVGLLSDLLEIIFLGENRESSRLRANDLRPIGILVRHLEKERNRVVDLEVRQSLPVIPTDFLFAAPVFEGSFEGH